MADMADISQIDVRYLQLCRWRDRKYSILPCLSTLLKKLCIILAALEQNWCALWHFKLVGVEEILCTVGSKIDTVYTVLEDYRMIERSKELPVRWPSEISTCETRSTGLIEVDALESDRSYTC